MAFLIVSLVVTYALLAIVMLYIGSGIDQTSLQAVVKACQIGLVLAILLSICLYATIGQYPGEVSILTFFFIPVSIVYIAIPATIAGLYASWLLYKNSDKDADFSMALYQFLAALLIITILIFIFLNMMWR